MRTRTVVFSICAGFSLTALVLPYEMSRAAPPTSPGPEKLATPAPGIIFGVNGHDGRTEYPLSDAKARFQLLNARNLRSYRFDVEVGDMAVLDTLVPLAKKYNITLRPMLSPASQAATYSLVKRYAKDIEVWEIGNEQDGDRAGAQSRINAMVATYRGIQQVSNELNSNLKASINIMACNSNDVFGACPNDPKGSLWFLDMAAKSGLAFKYITFHYYAKYGERGYWMNLYLGQMKAAAKKYNTKVFLNETNCGEVFSGNTDGGFRGDQGCYDGLKQLLDEVKAQYSDIVQEVNLYELLDSPASASGVDRHFGLMYNLNRPKPTLDLIAGFAK